MEDWIRVSAKTVADAVTEATIQLGTSSENIEYRVIEKGTAGFFGIGAKKAVIEAKKKKTDEDLMKEVFGDMDLKPKKEPRKEPKKETREKKENKKPGEDKKPGEGKESKKESRKDASRESGKEPKEGKKENRKEFRESRREEKDSSREHRPAKEIADQAEAQEAAGKAASREEEKTGRREAHREGRRNGQRSQRKAYRKEAERNAEERLQAADREDEQSEFADFVYEEPEERAPKAPREPADPEVAKSRAEEFLKNVFQTMGMEVQIAISFEEDVLSVNIDGEDMGILIGKRGQTLDSLQYLTSLVVNRGNASYVRVKLDTEDYRSRRKATLENLARNIAVKVKKTRRPVFLEPMNPYERRIIHSALQNDPYVTTHSEGEEPCRKVVVTLKKNSDRFERRGQRGDRRFSGRSDRPERSGRPDRAVKADRAEQTEEALTQTGAEPEATEE